MYMEMGCGTPESCGAKLTPRPLSCLNQLPPWLSEHLALTLWLPCWWSTVVGPNVAPTCCPLAKASAGPEVRPGFWIPAFFWKPFWACDLVGHHARELIKAGSKENSCSPWSRQFTCGFYKHLSSKPHSSVRYCFYAHFTDRKPKGQRNDWF